MQDHSIGNCSKHFYGKQKEVGHRRRGSEGSTDHLWFLGTFWIFRLVLKFLATVLIQERKIDLDLIRSFQEFGNFFVCFVISRNKSWMDVREIINKHINKQM